MTSMTPMKRLEPLAPLSPMKSLPEMEPWWPAELGSPSTAGAQNGTRYAVFPERRRILVGSDGGLATYDTGEHRIAGAAQQHGAERSLAFISQHGPVRLDALTRLG